MTIQDILDGDVAANFQVQIDKLTGRVVAVKEKVTTYLADGSAHVQSGEREKWNNEFSTYKVDKDDNSTFKTVEKRRVDGTLFATSVFSEPNADGNYLVRTFTEYAEDSVTALNTTVYDLLYDDDGDWINEVRRS